jgi:hypothetical protein
MFGRGLVIAAIHITARRGTAEASRASATGGCLRGAATSRSIPGARDLRAAIAQAAPPTGGQ